MYVYVVEWAEWSECTVPCGNGTQKRYKYCTDKKLECGKLEGSCNLKPCNGTYVLVMNARCFLLAERSMTYLPSIVTNALKSLEANYII